MSKPLFKRSLLSSAVSVALLISVQASAFEEDTNITKDEEIERVVVTGSRIARINTQTPSPVVTIDAAAIEATGILNMNDLLEEMPQFAEGFNNSSHANSFGNAGLNAANLRGLGTDRTLTIVNGRRVVQSTYDNGEMVTDTSFIPSALIDRIDVLTGGAASTYGADAVAGVVNFVMKKDFEGTKVTAQYGESEKSDGEETSISITSGLNFNNDKGNFVLSLDYYDQGYAGLANRPGSGAETGWVYDLNNETNDDGIPKYRTANNRAWPDYNVSGQMAGVWNYDTNYFDYYDVTGGSPEFMFSDNDRLKKYYVGDSDTAKGYNINKYSKIKSPYERNTAYALFNYELSDDIQLTSDLRYTKVKSRNTASPEYNYGLGSYYNFDSDQLRGVDWQHIDNFDPTVEVPNGVSDLLVGDDGWFITSIGLDEIGPRHMDTERDLFAFSTTVNGELSNGWVWDLYASTGKTSTEMLLKNKTNKMRFGRGDYATTDDEGNRCGVDVFTCPGSNPLMPLSQEAEDWIRLDPFGSQIDSEQHIFAGSISGDLFELPQGEVLFAAGIEVRRETLDMKVDDLWQDTDKTGGSKKVPWEAGKTIQEVFIEVEAPVLGNIFLVDELLLSAAGRISDYTYAGSNSTWKLGATWSIIDGLALRSTYAHTVRAPQLNEQFGGEQTGWSRGKDDPCGASEVNDILDIAEKALVVSNCQQMGIEDPENWIAATDTTGGVYQTTTGNTNLEPEKADTLTVGLVYSPSFIDNLDFTIDYYDIELEDAMARAGTSNTLYECVRSEDVNTSVYCPLITRGSDDNITDVVDTFVNKDKFTRRGVDTEIAYLQSLGEFGEISVKFNLTHILETSTQDSAEEKTVDYTGIFRNGIENKARLTLNYALNDLRINWTTNYSDGYQIFKPIFDEQDDGSEIERDPFETYDQPFTSSVTLHNVRVSYFINDDLKLHVGAKNVFDKTHYGHPSMSSGQGYADALGRYTYAGVSYEF
jgi:outer membrane receptor protein involved in Fe transport